MRAVEKKRGGALCFFLAFRFREWERGKEGEVGLEKGKGDLPDKPDTIVFAILIL